MALLESCFAHIDQLSLNTILHLQLEDSLNVAGSAKGKQREGTVSDAELALQLYGEDIRMFQETLADRTMAQSMAMAVSRDGQLIARVHGREDQVARDRQFALHVHQEADDEDDEDDETNDDTPFQKADSQPDPWADEEMLSKVAAIYNQDTLSSETVLSGDGDTGYASGDKLRVESSTWAAVRGNGKEKVIKTGTCVACGDTKEFFELARVPCNHEYCRGCLADLFRASMTDESLFPPRCDNKPIPIDFVRFFLPVELAKEFEIKAVELGSKNRIYCHDSRCSAFIPKSDAEEVRTDYVTCPQCDKTTCTNCKNAAHVGDCPADEALQQLIKTAEGAQWQRCRECKRFIELAIGCNHISCPCGEEFCYVCSRRWKTCACPQWDEPNLLARATQILRRERNPQRQLFQPEFQVRMQPPTRQPSPVPSRSPSPMPVRVAREGWMAALGGANATVPRRGDESPGWESDFSEPSTWEEDWSDSDVMTASRRPSNAATAIQRPSNAMAASRRSSHTATDSRRSSNQDISDEEIVAGPSSIESPTPEISTQPLHSRLETTSGTSSYRPRFGRTIQDVMNDLRANHECEHDKWKWVKGPHTCEECHFRLPQYIFECRQCELQACNRCRRNRL